MMKLERGTFKLLEKNHNPDLLSEEQTFNLFLSVISTEVVTRVI